MTNRLVILERTNTLFGRPTYEESINSCDVPGHMRSLRAVEAARVFFADDKPNEEDWLLVVDHLISLT